MTFRPIPHRLIETPLGELDVWATSESHFGFATAGNLNVERKEGEAVKSVLVNRVPLTLRIDITKTVEPKRWSVPIGDTGFFIADTHDLLMRRAESWSIQEASQAARQKVLKIMVPWIEEFLLSDAGQELLGAISDKAQRDRLDALDERLAAIDVEKEALAAEREALLNERGDLRQAMAS